MMLVCEALMDRLGGIAQAANLDVQFCFSSNQPIQLDLIGVARCLKSHLINDFPQLLQLYDGSIQRLLVLGVFGGEPLKLLTVMVQSFTSLSMGQRVPDMNLDEFLRSC